MTLMTHVASPLIRTLEITNLPSLPHILLRVLDMCNRDDASLHAIADIIGKDAALSSKVIGASNTAQFSRQNKLGTLEQTLALLGLDMVKTIAISSSFYQVFNNLSISPGFDLKAFWGRSLTSAVLAKLIAQEIAYTHAEEAYLTGLLLDIGQLVLWSNFPKQYAVLLADGVADDQLLMQEAEKIGNNHCEVGSWLVNNWNLSSFMADAVLYHHMPQAQIADAHQLIQIAYVANSMVAAGAETVDRFAAGEQLLGIATGRLRLIADSASELVGKVALSLGIEIDPPDRKAEPDGMRQQKMQLAMELRDIVLIGRNPLGAGTAVSLDDTLSSIQRSVQILFGIQNVVFFLPDQYGKVLKGKCLSGQGQMINEMSISLHKKNSLVTEAFITRKPVTSFASDENRVSSILDEQLVRQMHAEGFYCQPLFTQGAVVGVMLFGLSRTQLNYVKKQQKLMSMFAQQAAQALALLNAYDEQEQRIKSEVMASTRTHALQIVHEASNPLSIIQNYIKLLGLKLPKEDPAQVDLKIIKEEIDRVTRICRVVTAAAEAETNQLEELNVNDVIQNLCKIFLEPMFALHQVSVQTQFDSLLPNIVTNKDKLIQVLINLMKNAAEAMPNGGTLLIATHINPMRNGGEHIEISLKDNGPGIPAEVMEHLFKPVASSKGARHAGLGLSIVKGIVDELGGRIFCQSNEISGTVFQVLLPRQIKDSL
ncbi:MAG: HDOD domain-containing protein [Sulfuriferula sp.]|nr:HDOD domain-containing protein [Sulfuriferula sp.]